MDPYEREPVDTFFFLCVVFAGQQSVKVRWSLEIDLQIDLYGYRVVLTHFDKVFIFQQ